LAHDLVGDRDAVVAGVLDVGLHGVSFPSGFDRRSTGNSGDMIGTALGLVILGVVLLFLFPWAGIIVGAAGVLLIVLFLVGFGRRAQTGRP
jgi:NADH:ubiquinone oxidoreductase subunit 3 (subunit A)